MSWVFFSRSLTKPKFLVTEPWIFFRFLWIQSQNTRQYLSKAGGFWEVEPWGTLSYFAISLWLTPKCFWRMKSLQTNSKKEVRGQNVLFQFFNIIFERILKEFYWSLTRFNMREIAQLQRLLCHVTKKVNEVVFGKLSVFLALVKSKLAYGGVWIAGTFAVATDLVIRIRVNVRV